MDYMRGTYYSSMVLSEGADPTPGYWFPAPLGAEVLAAFSPFRARKVWAPPEDEALPLGESATQEFQFRGLGNTVGYDGLHFCGSMEAFERGGQPGDPEIETGPDGSAPCCGVNPLELLQCSVSKDAGGSIERFDEPLPLPPPGTWAVLVWWQTPGVEPTLEFADWETLVLDPPTGHTPLLALRVQRRQLDGTEVWPRDIMQPPLVDNAAAVIWYFAQKPALSTWATNRYFGIPPTGTLCICPDISPVTGRDWVINAIIPANPALIQGPGVWPDSELTCNFGNAGNQSSTCLARRVAGPTTGVRSRTVHRVGAVGDTTSAQATTLVLTREGL